jgi:hypothetical protein
MRRILVGYGTCLGNHLAASGSFSEILNYKQALYNLPKGNEIVLVAPSARRLSRGDLGEDGSNLARAVGNAAKKLITLSTLAAYPVKSLPFDETSAVRCASGRESAQVYTFERLVLAASENSQLLRLPDVFGPGLTRGMGGRLLSGDGSHINRVAIHQWYPVHRLERDIVIARYLRAPVVNLVSEPLSMATILVEIFPGQTGQILTPAPYSRIQTRYAEAFGGAGGYIMSAASVMKEIAQFVHINRLLTHRDRKADDGKWAPSDIGAPA